MAKYQLEVGARTVEDAMSAWRGGADRVELYVSPTEGALTPSAGLVYSAVAAKKAAGSKLPKYKRIPWSDVLKGKTNDELFINIYLFSSHAFSFCK